MKTSNMLYFTGDIHGGFASCVFYLTQMKGLKSCNTIVCGDIGMGFYNLNYYKDTFKHINKKLDKCDVDLYFVRGNHDNPIYFTDDTPLDIDFKHIHFVHDYDVLNIGNHNILCIGGATNTDNWHREMNKSRWEGDCVQQNDVTQFKNIDIVVSHCAPMFVSPEYECYKGMTIEDDENARRDRNILSNVYVDLIKSGNKLRFWFYGHYHKHYNTFVPNENLTDIDERMLRSGTLINETDFDKGCQFIGLNMLENKEQKIDIHSIFV